MNDKMTPDKERENCPCRKAIINPFDTMMMVVVRRLDKAYLELKRSKPPAKEAEFALRNSFLSCDRGTYKTIEQRKHITRKRAINVVRKI